MLNKRLLASAALAALTFVLPVQVLAAVGTFVFVVGDVRVVDRAGQSRPAARDIVLQEGETVVSGAGGTAQIRMVDNAFVAVRPDTELRFDQYRFTGREDGTESAFFSLLKGGFRSITGLIGQANKNRYSIRTPTATVGIRGTDHETYFVPPPAPGQLPIANPGTYNTVVAAPPGSGTFMESGGVRLEIAQSQIAYAPPNEAPVFVPSAAVFTTPAAAPTQKPAPEKPAAEKPAAEEPGAEKPAAEAPAEPVRETAVVDNTAEAGAAADAPSAPAAEGPASSAPAQARPVVATAPAVDGTATLDATQQTVTSGTGLFVYSLNTGLTTDIATGETFQQESVVANGVIIVGDFSALAQQQASAAQASLASATSATNAIPTLTSSANANNSTLQAIAAPSTSNTESVIDAVTGAISDPSLLSPANTQLALANTEIAKIAAAKSTASSALSSISGQLSIAQAALGSGSTPLDPNPTGAGSSLAAGCGTTKACADLAGQYAAAAQAAQAANNFTAAQNAFNNASTAAGRAAGFSQTANAARQVVQQAETTVAAQLAIAQTATAAALAALASAESLALAIIGGDPVQLANLQRDAAQLSLSTTNSAVTSLNSIVSSASSTNSTVQGLSPVSTAPATTAIGDAQTAVGNTSSGATLAVNSALSLSLSSAQTTASANVSTATGLQSTASSEASTASTAFTANGTFADVTAAPALSAMNTAKSSLDGAVSSVQSAKSSVDASASTLTTQQSTASSALTSANSALGTAQTQLAAADTENAKLAPAQSAASSAFSTVSTQQSLAQAALGSATVTDSNPLAANSSFASSCGSATACADLAVQYASAASSAPDISLAVNAAGNAGTAAARAASFRDAAASALSSAQAAQSTLNSQATIAQNAVSAAGSAVNASAAAAGTGPSGAQTLAGNASTAAGNAASAHTSGTGALTTSNSNLTTVQSQATLVTQNAAVAQYHNPYYATADAYGSVFLGNENVSAGNNKSANGATEAKANTVFVLDGNKNLVEIRNTDFEVHDFSGSPSPMLDDANVKFSGGAAQDGYSSIDTTRGSIYGGRWQGGSILVDDNANGVSVDYTVNLGVRSVHWLVMNQPASNFVQSRTGTTSYSVLGATRPTDAAGNVGTLNSASLTANFDTQQVGVALDLSIALKSLVLNHSGMPIQSEFPMGLRNYFGADAVPVTCTGAGCATSWESGLFGFFGRTDASAAGLVYEMKPVGTPAADLVQGNVAFTTGTPPPVRPQPAQLINIGYGFTDGVMATNTANFRVSGGGYVLDGAENLVSVTGEGEQVDKAYAVNGGTPVPATPGEVTLTSAEKIRYGSWTGATVSGTDFNGPFSNRAIDGNFHWIRGPLTSPFYLSEILTVTNATYTFAGGAVSDHTGTSGTVNSATLGINFNTLALNAGVNATIGANTWDATASNIALDGGGFFAATGSTSPHSLMTLTLNGSSTGTFGNMNGQLVGAGLEGALMSYAFGTSSAKASGTAAFTGPTQSASAPFTVGVVAQGMLAATGSSLSSSPSPLPGLEADFASNVDIMVTATSRIARDNQNQVNKFDGYVPLPQPSGCTSACSGVNFSPATFALRDANYPLDSPPSPGAPTPAGALTNTGSHAPTGITWGRYTAFVHYTDRLGGAGAFTANAFDVRQANWHGMWSPSMTSAPVLPTSGTFTYTQIGNTNPTDNLGNIGTLTGATLQANFTAMTVNSSVNINMPSGPGAGAWSASAANVPIQRGIYFEAGKGVSGLNNLTVNAPVAGATAGVVRGTFVGNHVSGTTGGVMKGVSLNVGGAAGTTVSTVVGFTK